MIRRKRHAFFGVFREMNPSSKTTFILLRDNKESAPMSLDALKALGLKTSDLLWVEGQSVYWLSPQQIPELRDLPLDEVKEPEITLNDIGVTEVGKEDATVQAKENLSNQTINSKAAKVIASGGVSNDWSQYVPKDANAPIVKETKPLAEVKELYSRDPLSSESRKPIKKTSLPYQSLMLYGALIVAGVALGIIIRGRHEKSPVIQQQNNPEQKITSTLPDSSATALTDTMLSPNVPIQSTVPPPEQKVNPKEPITSKTVEQVEKVNKDSAAPVIDNSVKTIVEPTREIKNTPRENMLSKVSVHANDYTVASFGGIRNLELTVNNESGVTLEKVAVELNYLKPRDELLKSEIIYFYLVPANGSQTVPIKKSNRGIKVTCRVVKVEPREGN